MIHGIEPFYQQIADSIQEAIRDEWTTARMDVIFYTDGETYEGEYISKTDGKLRGFATASSGERAFRELRKKFKEAGKRLWGQASFELHSNGKFNMKWGYEGCDENGNTIFDEAKELKRHEERLKRLN